VLEAFEPAPAGNDRHRATPASERDGGPDDHAATGDEDRLAGRDLYARIVDCLRAARARAPKSSEWKRWRPKPATAGHP